MGSKSGVILMFLLIFLVTPCFARGMGRMDTEIYEIDYRGPETHSFIPPPYGSGERPKIHHRNVFQHRKSKDSTTGQLGCKGKKIRG